MIKPKIITTNVKNFRKSQVRKADYEEKKQNRGKKAFFSTWDFLKGSTTYQEREQHMQKAAIDIFALQTYLAKIASSTLLKVNYCK
jgi:hypothetical protein